MARRRLDSGIALTKELIVETACKLVRQGALDDIKTTAIGEALGVTQPAIYHHYKSRAQLVADVVDIVCSDIAAKMTAVEGGWKESTRDFVEISAEKFVEYRGVANYLQTYGPYEPAARAVVDNWVGMFRRNGFSDTEAALATFHVNQYLLGHFSWYDTNFDVGPNRHEDSPLSQLKAADYKETPNALLFDTLTRTVNVDQRLRDGIELLILGISEQRSKVVH
ncbi:MAG: TetR/AcrR family transcriptional regulator [Sphingorhabdus sp.]